MTEVRVSPGRGSALFATKAYEKGSLLLEEEPIFVPPSDEESKTLLGNNTQTLVGEGSKRWESDADFRGMVMAGICWIQLETSLQDSDKKLLMGLYYPSVSDLENPTVEAVAKAIDHLKELCGEEATGDWKTLETYLLIWACNSFEGGRIYAQISRINHDCNPNAVVQTDGDTQRILAAADIAEGEEITISYLGILLYTETSVRKEKLRTTKFFVCQCQRCLDKHDVAGYIPCPVRHPREFPQQSLEEDVQYDDDQTVHYVSIGDREKNDSTVEKKLRVVMKNVTSRILTYLDSIKGGRKKEGDDDGDNEFLEESLGLATTIMGDRHWTTNLLRLLHLDHRLSLMSEAMLTMQEMPEMEDIAEAIDSLQRVERFVHSLDLKLDSGHILCDVIIGISRTLVSLGDIKSQKYGAQWLGKISDYVEMFESEGRQKVVSALIVAWKKHDTEGESHPATKKLKSS